MALPYYVLTGPTAAGKTGWLVNRARTQRLFVVSADSRQVYQHMNIGTGKPALADREILPHQGLDYLELNKNFSAYQFLDLAAQGLALARTAGREAWICGGTGLYLRALIDALELGLPPRPRLRAAIAQLLKECPPVEAANRLQLTLAERHNPVRVARAAELACADLERAKEIYREVNLDPALATADGRIEPSEAQRAEQTRQELSRWRCAGIAVLDPGPELAQRIVARTTAMFEQGLVEEVARIRALGYGDCVVVRDGIGYREAGQVLDGQLSLALALERTIIRTRQYAKRQRTYFRSQRWPQFDLPQLDHWAATL